MGNCRELYWAREISVERERKKEMTIFSLPLEEGSPFIRNCETRLIRRRKSIRVTQIFLIQYIDMFIVSDVPSFNLEVTLVALFIE